ncbi:MAG TPA: histidinol-phosphate transaminase [Spirochaetia bacterium]|nr:histidinol-phosphate transaminase [Spirochaetia bacterium]
MKDLNARLNPGILDIKPYQPGKTVAEARADDPSLEYIKLASNENPFGLSPRARQAVLDSLEEAYAYPEVSCAVVRHALSRKLGIGPDHFIIGNGGDGIIYACAMAMLAEGDEAIIPEITFPYYEIAVRAMRGRVVRSRMTGEAIDLDDILKKLSSRTKMIWLCNPNNPTGSLTEARAFTEFFKAVPEDVFVIHDEVYADFAPREAFPDTLALIRAGADNLVLIRSFSKIYGMAGLRVGYGVGQARLVNMLYRVRPPFDISVVAQAAAAAAVADDAFYAKTLALTETEKTHLTEALTSRNLGVAPSATNFLLVDLGQDGGLVTEKLCARGVIVRPMNGYSLPNRIRVTIGTREQNDRFLAALDEVLA